MNEFEARISSLSLKLIFYATNKYTNIKHFDSRMDVTPQPRKLHRERERGGGGIKSFNKLYFVFLRLEYKE